MDQYCLVHVTSLNAHMCCSESSHHTAHVSSRTTTIRAAVRTRLQREDWNDLPVLEVLGAERPYQCEKQNSRRTMNESIISFSAAVCRVVSEGRVLFYSHHFIWIRGDRRVGRCQCPARPFGRCSALHAFLPVVDGRGRGSAPLPLLEAVFFGS